MGNSIHYTKQMVIIKMNYDCLVVHKNFVKYATIK